MGIYIKNMRVEYIIIIIIFIHWVGDFLCQTFEMATKKSTSNFHLFTHVCIYSLVWLFAGIFFFRLEQVMVFVCITFQTHFMVDYITSRWTSKLHKKEKFYGFPAFFSVIGLDQFIHYAQLILTYMLINTF